MDCTGTQWTRGQDTNRHLTVRRRAPTSTPDAPGPWPRHSHTEEQGSISVTNIKRSTTKIAHSQWNKTKQTVSAPFMSSEQRKPLSEAAFLPRLRGPTNHKATSKVNCVMEKGISRIQSENQSIMPPSTSELTPT